MQHMNEQEERFQLLLKQAEIPEEYKKLYFIKGRIDRLALSRQNKQWTFHFHFQKLLPCPVYRAFLQKIQITFSHIALVDCCIEYTETIDLKSFIDDYWDFIIDEITEKANGVAHALKNGLPTIENDRILVIVDSELTEKVIKKKELDRLISYKIDQLIGVDLPVTIRVDESEEAYQSFFEQTLDEDRIRAMDTLDTMMAQETERANNPTLTDSKQEFLIGQIIKEDTVPIQNITDEERRITVQGQVFVSEIRKLRSGRSLLTFKITDYTDSISAKIFSRTPDDLTMMEAIKEGMWVKVRGRVQYDQYVRELAIEANDVNLIKPKEREDTASEKRIELHLHTPMSHMDAISPVDKLVEQAAKWGHSAIAITDHAAVQSFPEAYSAGQKAGIKIIYGLEANVVNDGVPIAYDPRDSLLKEETYVVFDVETTGLSAVYNSIIELAGVKFHNGEVIDRFERFVNPHEPLSNTIIELTGITDDMLVDAPEIANVLYDFRDFVGDSVLVAHNARFDMGFLNAGFAKINEPETNNSVIDTLEFSRFILPELRNHRLNTLTKHLGVELVSHHRAVYDAEATAEVLWKLILSLEKQDIHNMMELNDCKPSEEWRRQRPFHTILLAKNQVGLRNLYILVSKSHIDYFHRVPRIPRSELVKHREGLIIGSGCARGELFETVMQKSLEDAEQVARFYDYLEIQPTSYNHHLVERELVNNEEDLKEINRKIIQLGKKLNKPVAATGNVHYIDPHEKIYRQILVKGLGGASMLNADTLPDAHFRTTNEFLDEFSYLGEELAHEVVLKGPQQIDQWIEEIRPVPEKLYTPVIEGANEEIEMMSYTKAKGVYGDPLPDIVERRLTSELTSIIQHGFAVIYLISHKLVKKSLDDGYLVGSRGSVGSSFAATMMEITEVNPLPPHYVCPTCQHTEFITDGSVASGYDLLDKSCAQCSAAYIKDGHDIPFETFLGFDGDKVPDIDLNFSGDYQSIAHNYTRELFGDKYVYRAGTIGTVADKTAYGFVKKFEEEMDLQFKNTEILRLASGFTGVKRSTGQHPGGIIVVPENMDIYDFSPIQYPANDRESEWKTTHFDFHSIDNNLLKLDILGHDDPTMIRMLQDLTGVDPKEIPIADEQVMGIFSGTEPLGVTPEQIRSKIGSLGIPEFGTRFVRQMLEATRPSSFAELVQISGLSHGTDVWLNNAQELVENGTCTLKDVIGCRDDIMVYLMYREVESSLAFNIMESVRKGRGLTPEMEEAMKQKNIPDWYIWSCKQIKYMFPKAHATAYVLMAVRIAYFKVHYPIEYYATYFTVRAADFDIPTMIKGSTSIRNKIMEIEKKGFEASTKERNTQTVLELALEMCERGYQFKNVDLYRSDAQQFLVDEKGLIPPFSSLPGVGTTAAINIENAREQGEFLSIEDLQQRSKVSRTVLEFLEEQGCLEGLPASNQLSLF